MSYVGNKGSQMKYRLVVTISAVLGTIGCSDEGTVRGKRNGCWPRGAGFAC
jgi:hypothetical protein